MEDKIQQDKKLGEPLYTRILEGLCNCGIYLDDHKIVFASIILPEEMNNGTLDKIRLGCTDEYFNNLILKFLEEYTGNPINFIKNLKNEIQSNNTEIVINTKELDTDGGIAKKLWQTYLFVLPQKEKHFTGLLQYILETIMEKMEHINGADINKKHQNKEKDYFFFWLLEKRWILLRSYADYFLKNHNLPDAELLIQLAAIKYEGSESEARIYFKDECITTVAIISKKWEVSKKNRNVIRKLMEISKRQQLFLFAECKYKNRRNILEISRIVSANSELGSYIKFAGYLNWSIICKGKEEIIYSNGNYKVNNSVENKTYEQDIRKMNNINESEKNMLIELLNILKEQKHGTAIIVADQCIEEVNRLCDFNRGIKLINEKPHINYNADAKSENGWNREQILSITGIDGALFLDWEGNCLAIGVIVDGEAQEKGDAGRGARYNSIKNYVNQKNNSRYLGIIVSEDGWIDFVGEVAPEYK